MSQSNLGWIWTKLCADESFLKMRMAMECKMTTTEWKEKVLHRVQKVNSVKFFIMHVLTESYVNPIVSYGDDNRKEKQVNLLEIMTLCMSTTHKPLASNMEMTKLLRNDQKSTCDLRENPSWRAQWSKKYFIS